MPRSAAVGGSAAEERRGLGHGHAEHIVDVAAIDLDFQHRVGEAAALAGVAGQGHIRHELHADGDAALAFTGLAAATAGVEAEHDGSSPGFGPGLGGKQTAYIVPGLDIGGGVGPAALANGVLVDEFDHLDAVRLPVNPRSPGRLPPRSRWREERVENALHQGALPEPDTPVTTLRAPSRNRASMPWRLCSLAFSTVISPTPGRRFSGTGMRRLPLR